MVHLIDKDALVAEIERLVNNQDSALDYEAALEDVRNFLDTLEVKEIASLQEEPVSIDFEQELYKAFGQVKDFTLGMRIAKWFYDMGKNCQVPVSEELEEAVNAYIGYAPEVDECSSVYGKRQAFKAGAQWQKNKMMEDAMDGIIAESAGGGGWVNVMTGFVKSKDVNVKFGDKIKIIVIKEE